MIVFVAYVLRNVRGELLYEFFVFLDDDRCCAPVVRHVVCFVAGKLLVEMLEQTPVGVAETIDTLLDITHDEVVSLIALAFSNERHEVFPLQCAGILKLINHIVTKVLSEAFVDEWCILSVDDLVY